MKLTEQNTSPTPYLNVSLDIKEGKYPDFALEAMLCAINLRRNVKMLVAAKSFRIGQKVEFLNKRNGLTVVGVVSGVHSKNVDVFTGQQTWRVTPSLLKRVAA